MKMRRSRKPRPGTRRAGARFARSAHFYFHTAPSSGFVRLGLLSLSSFGGGGGLRFARVRVRAPRCPIQFFGSSKFVSEISHDEARWSGEHTRVSRGDYSDMLTGYGTTHHVCMATTRAC